MKEVRDAQDERTRKTKSQQIVQNLKNMPEFKNAETICIYLSTGSEVETHQLVEQAINEGKTVVVPVTKDKTITLSKLQNMNNTRIGAYNILEPTREHHVHENDVDVFIVPGIAFDKCCSRIGYGAGYYDKLLRTSTKPKLALAYNFQIVETIPASETDIPMDKVITESEVYGKNT